MMLGSWGNPDHDDSIRIIRAAFDGGINFIDTADMYSAGESEVIVGKALKEVDRYDVILATKVQFPMGSKLNMRGTSRRWIIQACDASLRRLGTDWIDLYQIHRPNFDTDIDETLGALTDLVRAGKVRYIGSSTFPPSSIVEAQWVAQHRHRERFVTEQPPYSILARGAEAEVLPICEKYRMGVISWSPLAGGWLSGAFGSSHTKRADRVPSRYDLSLPDNQRKLAALKRLEHVSAEHGLSLIDVAIAFVLEHPTITSAIIGPRTLAHFTSQIAAADLQLSEEILDQIDEIVPPGIDLNVTDNGLWPPSLTDPAKRRSRFCPSRDVV